jgi:hypothetical protein
MPNCFCLTKIGEKEPSKLSAIDDEIRQFFNQPADDTNYLWHWYDIIGLYLALGKTFDEIYQSVDSTELKAVCKYLQDRYSSDAWVSRR